MTKIIPITQPKTKTPQDLTEYRQVWAAWNFAYAALWSHRQFSNKELSLCRQHIAEHFSQNGHRKKSFLVFCERIVLARVEAAENSDTNLPAPSVWFNPAYTTGYAATLEGYQQIMAVREYSPGFREGSALLARLYLGFVTAFNSAAFERGRSRLIRLAEYDLSQLFCNAASFHFFLNPR